MVVALASNLQWHLWSWPLPLTANGIYSRGHASNPPSSGDSRPSCGFARASVSLFLQCQIGCRSIRLGLGLGLGLELQVNSYPCINLIPVADPGPDHTPYLILSSTGPPNRFLFNLEIETKLCLQPRAWSCTNSIPRLPNHNPNPNPDPNPKLVKCTMS